MYSPNILLSEYKGLPIVIFYYISFVVSGVLSEKKYEEFTVFSLLRFKLKVPHITMFTSL